MISITCFWKTEEKCKCSYSTKNSPSYPAVYVRIPVYKTSDLLYIFALAGNQPRVLPQRHTTGQEEELGCDLKCRYNHRKKQQQEKKPCGN